MTILCNIFILIINLKLYLNQIVPSQDLRKCGLQDVRYEYSSCENQEYRWRFAVPKFKDTLKKCSYQNSTLFQPVISDTCTTDCQPGEYYDIDKTQSCVPCPPGTYSYGDIRIYDDWDEAILQKYFKTDLEYYDIDYDGTKSCPESSWWFVKDNALFSSPKNCIATLSHTVILKKEGTLRFQYMISGSNIIFSLNIQADTCSSVDQMTIYLNERNGDSWVNKETVLHTGKYNIHWVVTLATGINFGFDDEMNKGVNGTNISLNDYVKINFIEITGIALIPDCRKCKPGYYASNNATSKCTPCPYNSYSPSSGATECMACKSNEYSSVGAAKCVDKPACKSYNFFEIESVCLDYKSTKTYEWMSPKFCNSSAINSIQLPLTQKDTTCSRCNSGYFINTLGKCQACPKNTYNDGYIVKFNECRKCPIKSHPRYNLNITSWLDPDINISKKIESSNEGVNKSQIWIHQKDFIQNYPYANTSFYIFFYDFLLNSLDLYMNDDIKPLGFVEFELETKCAVNCSLSYRLFSHDKSVHSFGSLIKQKVSIPIKTKSSQIIAFYFESGLKSDYLRIYSLNVTNLDKDKGAVGCIKCDFDSKNRTCASCATNQYYNLNQNKCMQCPKNTVIVKTRGAENECCKECMFGKIPVNATYCATSCTFTIEDVNYNFTKLAKIHVVKGMSQFRHSGLEHYSQFNISLCGDGILFPQVSCSSKRLHTVDASMICQNTVYPSFDKDKTKKYLILSTAVSIADNLVNITRTDRSFISLFNQTGFPLTPSSILSDINFVYEGHKKPYYCNSSRKVVVTLRCDKSIKELNHIEIPPNCHQATCDGCTFHFLWNSYYACPICNNQSVVQVKGECTNGMQTLHYFENTHCRLETNGTEGLYIKSIECSDLNIAVRISVVVCVLVACILLLFIGYCWRKNRNLEYKYMRLIQSNDADIDSTDGQCMIDNNGDDSLVNHLYNTNTPPVQYIPKIFRKSKNKKKNDLIKLDDLNNS
ncbi:hypothetical protein A3Q56_02346 [Intoshia linei]|uniref:MRH domain-containing protein n=1 Tax=Intoshia linei TaxID=1819745 RepID=A0A177B6N6_9BILA|nr:hypothetical protein A3Q56_02346 [Intoshia linei]